MALEIDSVKFSCMDPERIRQLSVVQISLPDVVDNLNRPIAGGLYDGKMGPIDRQMRCMTCSLSYKECPGHMGHIELPVPVYNPLLFKDLYRLLRSKCFMCHHLKLKDEAPTYVAKLQLLDAGLVEQALALDSGPKRRAADDDDGGGGAGEDGEGTDADAARHTRRLREADKLAARRARRGLGREKHSQCEKLRRETVREILGKMTGMNTCEWCGNAADTLRKDGTTKIFRVPRKGQERMRMTEGQRDGKAAAQEFLHAMDAEQQLQSTWDADGKLLSLLFGGATAGSFFLHALGVPPNRFRPAAHMAGMLKEHQQNISYGRILKASSELLAAAPAGEDGDGVNVGAAASLESVLPRMTELQTSVDALYDSNAGGSAGGAGIKQQLEKKEGLFRKHMMGKRVNFAARSVISPDPNIATNEIGVPVRFASKLTYPEPVTPHNVAMLRQLVENGTEVYPGANYVEDAAGHRIDLSKLTREQRTSHARTLLTGSASDGDGASSEGASEVVHGSVKKVYRQLLTGDFLLVNRQPTLHKPGIMAHKARILHHDKVIRMHYANCNTYNADFDGDEMNLHFPQDEMGRAEAMFICLTDQQYLVPTDGSPLRGLIQDHVVAGVLLTKRDTFLRWEEMQQLLYVACQGECDDIESCSATMPAILKPVPLWTGKQVISCILKLVVAGRPPMNMDGKTKTPGNSWGMGQSTGGCEEDAVVVRDGELLQGILDKKQFGAEMYGIVHSVFELYGPTVAGKLLTVFGRLFTLFLQGHGFTCGIDDLLLSQEAETTRRSLQSKIGGSSAKVEREFVGLSPEANTVEVRAAMSRKMQEKDWKPKLDSMLRQVLSKASDGVRDACIPVGAYKLFPQNCFTLMTTAGAKGSKVNHQQITCQLGQQELEGARVPIMVSGKSLPCFAPHCLGYREGGYIADRFLTGVRPPEYFFHCMSGREGLVDTAVKTSRSGYLQRCLIKHMEELRVHYDYTVRGADGTILQFLYGEDALDVMKIAYMRNEDNLKFLASNYRALVDAYQPRTASAAVNIDKAPKHLWKAIKKPANHDPALSKLSPGTHLGAVSENFAQMVRDFVDKEDPQFFKVEGDQDVPGSQAGKPTGSHFEALMHLKYLRSLADPGEPVGTIAGQSVGEPSTQMTLNTFHFAGVGGHNVTLGIPRLRELLMTASTNVKTPLMTLPLKRFAQKENMKEFLTKHKLQKYMKNLSTGGMTDLVQLHRTSISALGKAGIKASAARRLMAAVSTLADLDAVVRETGCRGKEPIAKQLANDLQRVYLSSVLAGVTVEQTSRWCTENQSTLRVYTIQLDIARPEQYASVYTGPLEGIQTVIDNQFWEKLKNAVSKELKRRVDGVVRAETGAPERATVDGEWSAEAAEKPAKRKAADSDDDDVDDDDATSNRRHRQRQEKDSHYSEDEDSDDSVDAPANDADPSPKQAAGPAKERSRIGKTAGDPQFDAKKRRWSYQVEVDAKDRKLLMAELVESIAKEVILKQAVEGVMTCLLVEDERSGEEVLHTAGVNMMTIREYASIVDMNRIDTNDVDAILRSYGIEAARGAIIRQIRGVFGVYGIDIDPRHLNLIADYMTATGTLRPFNRMGIESNASPFLKMSFETCTQFLTQSTLDGDCDTLKSPSARLVLGKVVENGTGSFDLLHPIGA
jgi:DNA-directed RNA polymerase I subunit RPA1